MLFENVESVLNCTSYSFESEDALHLDLDVDLINEETASDGNDDSDKLYDDEREKENIVQHQFSSRYMKNVVDFYDEKNG